MLCEAIGSQVEENGYVFCLHEELSHLLTCGKNLLAPCAIGFYVESRKSVSLFFALICFSFDWRLLDSSNGPLVSAWRLARFVLWLLIGGEGRTWVGWRHRLTSFPRHSHGLSAFVSSH